MAAHIHKCNDIICNEQGLEHCCLKHDNVTQNVIAYCCDIVDYLDKHIVPPMYHSFTYEIETPPLHFLEPHGGMTTVFHERTPVAVSHLPNQKSHPPSRQEALGWTYIGIASGIAVLLMFFIVVIAIAYILYRWKNKDRRLRYQADDGHEVVVYHSNSGQIIETGSAKTYTNSCDKPTTSDVNSPPPYIMPKKTLDSPSQVSVENEKTLKALPQIT